MLHFTAMHMTSIRRRAIPLLGVAAAAFLAACSDPTVAPRPISGGTHVLVQPPVGAPNPDVIIDYMAPDSTSADFTVTPTGGTFRLGQHGISFPDHAICDPATSGYGPAYWDQPCTPLDQPIQIHAEVRSQDGRSWVDFTPELRFVPTDDSNHYVWMLMYSAAAEQADSTTLGAFGILWAPAIGDTTLVDEAATDSTMVTYLHQASGTAYRRIKHFSGYTINTGFTSYTYSDVLPVAY